MRTFVVGHDFFNSEDRGEPHLVENANEMTKVSLFGHLQHDLCGKFLSMKQNIGQFGFHEQIWVRISIALCVNSSPGRTYDEGVSCKRFNLKKIHVDKFKLIEALLVYFHVVLHHLEFVRVQVVDDVLLKIVTEMYGDSSHPRERLKYLLDAHPNKPLSQVVGNCLRNNRVPTLLVDGNALFEAGEEEIAFVEVAEEGFGDAVLLFECGGAVVVKVEVKVTGMDL